MGAKTLYSCYTDFCKDWNRKDILKFKDFNNALKNTYGMKRTRHHFTDGRNPTGFDRIVINSAPNGQYTVQKKEDEPLSSKEAFFLKLEQMEQEVRAHFPQYPFD